MTERAKAVKREMFLSAGLAGGRSWRMRCSRGSEERETHHSVAGWCGLAVGLGWRFHGTKAWWALVMSRTWPSSLHFSTASSLA